MSYEVKTRVFEGPFDLLLQLITSHQVQITELRLAEIVTEYLEYLDAMRELDMEVTSEFLLIAATLVQLKARHLLPDGRELDLDEELALAEERDRLLSRLLSSLTFKDVAAVLAHRMEGSDRFVARLAGIEADVAPRLEDYDLGVDAHGLAAIAGRALDMITEPDLDHLDLDLPSVDDAISDLQRRLRHDAETDFESLVEHVVDPLGVIAYFLALLELVHWGAVLIGQEHEFAAISVQRNPRRGGELDISTYESEWGSI